MDEEVQVFSSEKMNLAIFDTWGMSFMYMIKNKGTKTLPWGTPHSMCLVLETVPSIETNCILF